MTIANLVFTMVMLTAVFIIFFWVKLFSQKEEERVSLSMSLKLVCTGVIAYLADTIGIGSFGVITALSSVFKMFSVAELPAVMNVAQVIPGTYESLFFLKIIYVNLSVLITFVVGACIGGVFGAHLITRMNERMIRLTMASGYGLILLSLIGHNIHWLPMVGQEFEFNTWRLVWGFWGMILCGSFASVGVGMFVSVQTLLYLLDVSPILAFPIMATAGAMQQPMNAMIFMQHQALPYKKILIISLTGLITCYLMLPFFNKITVTWLHYLLMLVLTYNIIHLCRGILSGTSGSSSLQTA